MKPIFNWIYLLIGIGVLASLNWRWDYPTLHLIIKAMLMPVLIIGCISSIDIRFKAPGFFLFIALILSLLGDILMAMEDEPEFFTLGLASFLLAHVCYIITFRKSRLDNYEILLTKKLPLLLFLFIGLALFIFAILRPDLHDMDIPVFVYIVAITLMTLAALNRYGKAGLRSFWRVLTGALLFMASDMLIAFDRFADPIPNVQYLILGGYALAQWLIATGIILQEKKTTKTQDQGAS